jgi:DegV family protein with EDD domain
MVKIVTDTTAGLPRELTQQLGIPVLPQLVIFGDDSYRDDSDLDTAVFLEKLKASPALPKTAAPPPALYNPVYERLTRNGDAVIVLAPSAKVSGTVRSAEVAAQDFPGADIRVVDTQVIAGNFATLVLLADQLAKAGLSADQIVARINDWIPRQRTYFLVDTLEYLQKGGRIGGAKALLGEMLQIKPILRLDSGQVEPCEQQRTKRRATARLIEIVEEQCPKGPESHLCVMQAGALNEATSLAEELKTRMGLATIPIYELPPAIVVHAGPGVMAVGFFTASS